MANDLGLWAALACALPCLISAPALADETPAQPPSGASATTSSTTTQQSAPPTVTLPMPGMTGPLALSSTPFALDAGSFGKIYVSGVASGLGLWQDHPTAGSPASLVDLSNGQVFIQKTDGVVQFYLQLGAYSIPALGTPYIRAGQTVSEFYGAVPQGFLKIAPTSNFSIEAGALPTLIGAEYTFTFENMNIERGLLWNQENAVNRGVQINYTAGPLAFALSLNDGFYSGRFNWLTGQAVWTIDSADTLTLDGGGNLGRTATATLATPLPQNNSQIYNLIYTRTAGPWTVTPYLQYTHVPTDAAIGLLHQASTYGGAVLANYAFTKNLSLAGRIEYIASTGSLSDGAPNLTFGPGSKAWSFTLTPTYQWDHFFVRGEGSLARAFDTTPGFAFGPNGTQSSQIRGLVEAGVIF